MTKTVPLAWSQEYPSTRSPPTQVQMMVSLADEVTLRCRTSSCGLVWSANRLWYAGAIRPWGPQGIIAVEIAIVSLTLVTRTLQSLQSCRL